MANKKDLLLFSLQKEPVDPWICSSCRSAFATFALLESHQCINKDRVLTTRFRPPNKLGPVKAKSKLKGKLRGSALGKSITQCYGTISCSSAAKHSCASSGSTCDALVRFIPKWRNGRSSLLKGKEVKQPDSYSCRLCGKIFDSIEKLTVHTYAHKGERPYKCPQHGCTKAFISKYKLLRYSSEGNPFLVGVWGKNKDIFCLLSVLVAVNHRVPVFIFLRRKNWWKVVSLNSSCYSDYVEQYELSLCFMINTTLKK